MPQAELRQPVPITHPVETRVLAGADEIAGRLQLRCRRVDGLEQPAGMEAGELARVAPVGLDSIAWPLRHQARRHNLTGDPSLDQVAASRRDVT